MKTKLFTLLLAIVASVGTMFASTKIGDLYYNLDATTKTATVASNSNASGDIVIPTSVTYNAKNYSVTSIGSSAFYGCTGLTSVTIPNSVTSIGSSAFKGCSGLTSVTIGNSVTSIGDGAFDGCSGLTSVTIPNSVTSIGGMAFWGCSGLTSVTIGNSVTSIGDGAFYNCSGLTSVTIGNSVTSIGSYAFNDCSGLTSVTIGNGVTTIGEEAFAWCDGLTSVTIPYSVTSIGGSAFSYCSGLTSIIVENGNSKYDSRNNCNAIIKTANNELILGCQNTIIPNSVTSIGGSAFSGCTGLTSVTIPNSVTSIGNRAFYGCSGLTSVTIGNSVTTIGGEAFYNCQSLTSVTIGNSVATIGNYAFYNCSGLTSITIPNSVTSIGYRAFRYCSGLTSATIGNSVTSIGDGAFDGCSGLTSVAIGNSVTSIGYEAFYGCSNITSVVWNAKNSNSWNFGSKVENFVFGDCVEVIPGDLCKNMNKLSKIEIPNCVTSIGDGAFDGCSNITSVVWNAKNSNSWNFGSKVENFVFGDSIEIIPANLCRGMNKLTYINIPNSVTSIGYEAFSGCTGLTSVTIPNSVTSIGYRAFRYCSGLTSVTIGNSVTSIGDGAFDGCSGLTSVTIPNSVTSIGGMAFWGCSGLTSVTIGNSVTSIGGEAFKGCSNIKSIVWNAKNSNCYNFGNQIEDFVFGDSVEVIPGDLCKNMNKLSKIEIPNCVTSIGDGAFYGCTGLTSATIGNSVTSIGSGVFSGCSGLTSVTIGNSVTTIGGEAFYNCQSLTSVTIPNSVTSIGDYAFSYCKIDKIYFSGTMEEWLSKSWTPNQISSSYSLYINDLAVSNAIMPNSLTSIGERAFSNCTGLTSVTIPNSVTVIGQSAFRECNNLKNVIIGSSVKILEGSAFFGCSSIESFTCYGQRPPTVNQYALYGLDYSTIVYVPADYLETYKMHDAWGLYDVRPLEAESTETTDVSVTPADNTAEVVWPAVSGAATYELVIKDKSGNVICTLIFNANGQLTQIVFHAPARNNATQQTQTAGFAFTVTGLDSGTNYDVVITSKDSNGSTLDTKTVSFTTTGEAQGIDDVQSHQVQSTKIIRNGQIYILRGDKVYTIEGRLAR